MKISLPFLSLAATFAFGAFLPPARAAAIYSTGVTLTGSGPNIFAWTQPNVSGFGAGLFMEIDAGNFLRPVNYTVGIHHVWYRALPGQILDPSYVATATPFFSAFAPTQRGEIELLIGQPFLLGFWLDANGDRTPNLGDRFGWARLRQESPTTLSLLDNAIEDAGGGIIAGTTIAVPEPSPVALGLSAAWLCLLRRTPRNR